MDSTRVLLVDDDILCNLALNQVLQDNGFYVEAVYCGTAALASIRRHTPWAVVTDVDLGRGPDGFDVARFARARNPGMPVVFISGQHGARHPREGVAGSAFVPKPCNGGAIVAALRRATHLEAA